MPGSRNPPSTPQSRFFASTEIPATEITFFGVELILHQINITARGVSQAGSSPPSHRGKAGAKQIVERLLSVQKREKGAEKRSALVKCSLALRFAVLEAKFLDTGNVRGDSQLGAEGSGLRWNEDFRVDPSPPLTVYVFLALAVGLFVVHLPHQEHNSVAALLFHLGPGRIRRVGRLRPICALFRCFAGCGKLSTNMVAQIAVKPQTLLRFGACAFGGLTYVAGFVFFLA